MYDNPGHLPFLREIIDAPDDDAPRLIYAGWLEEHGDPRGEFIRVQCEKDHLAWHEPRYIELEEREQALVVEHQAQWTNELSQANGFSWGVGTETLAHELIWNQVLFRRGMAEAGSVRKVRPLLEAQQQLLGETLLRELRIVDLPPRTLKKFLQSPWGERLRGLYMSTYRTGAKGLEILAGSSARERLEYLSLFECYVEGYYKFRNGLRWLTSLEWPCLRWLNLALNNLQHDHLPQISQWPGLENLQGLGLAHHHLPQIALLFAGGRLKRIHYLDLGRCELTDDSLEAIAAARLEQLTHLSVAGNYHANIASLFRNSPLPHLRVFACDHTLFNDNEAFILADSPQFATMRVFFAGGLLQFTSKGLSTLVRSPYAANLRRLSIRDTPIDDEALPALLESPSLAGLQYLNIGGANFSADGREKLKKRFKNGLVENPRGP